MGATPILLRGEKHDVVRIEPVPSVLDDAYLKCPMSIKGRISTR